MLTLEIYSSYIKKFGGKNENERNSANNDSQKVEYLLILYSSS